MPYSRAFPQIALDKSAATLLTDQNVHLKTANRRRKV
jgi:hypothetical protein